MNDTLSENQPVKATIGMPRVWTTQLTATLEILFAIIAIFGNIVFVGAVVLKKKLRTLANAFLVNLSMTDIAAAVLVSSFSIDSYLKRGWALGHTLCVFHNILHPTFMSVSLILTSCISVNRYVYVVHHNMYRRITNKITVTLALLFSWGFPLTLFFVSLPAHSKYSPPTFRCRVSISTVWFALTHYVPSLFTIIFYILIFVYVRKSRKRVQVYPGPSTSTNNGQNAQEVRMLKVLLAVSFLVVMGYLPYAVLVNIYILLKIPPPVEVFILLYPCIHIAGVLNPVLYGASNRNFRVAYRELLTGKLFCNKVVSPNGKERQPDAKTSAAKSKGKLTVSETVSAVVATSAVRKVIPSTTATSLVIAENS
ncbi:histamine H2 receptor-like [Ptychodera flava]|uniref:histamine H2 receptor-like n=1 Tax=Ptychodera flava TaxID=63121 RepID=UPI003969FB2F